MFCKIISRIRYPISYWFNIFSISYSGEIPYSGSMNVKSLLTSGTSQKIQTWINKWRSSKSLSNLCKGHVPKSCKKNSNQHISLRNPDLFTQRNTRPNELRITLELLTMKVAVEQMIHLFRLKFEKKSIYISPRNKEFRWELCIRTVNALTRENLSHLTTSSQNKVLHCIRRR